MRAAETHPVDAAEPLLTPAARRAPGTPAFRWSIAPAVTAWLLLAWLSGHDRALSICVVPRITLLDGAMASVAAGFAALDAPRWVGEWALMIAAMMLPLLVPMIGHVAYRSFVPRRDRAVGLFVGGYVLTWLAVGVVACVVLIVVRGALASLGLAPAFGLIGCTAAALWQLSPAKRRAVNRCHGTVALRPFGAAADADALQFGFLHGGRCVRACLPTMALPLLGGHSLAAMATIFAILLAERARPTPQYGLSAIALLLLGLISTMAGR